MFSKQSEKSGEFHARIESLQQTLRSRGLFGMQGVFHFFEKTGNRSLGEAPAPASGGNGGGVEIEKGHSSRRMAVIPPSLENTASEELLKRTVAAHLD